MPDVGTESAESLRAVQEASAGDWLGDGLRSPQKPAERLVRADALMGPHEVSALTGIPLGSLAWAIRRHGLPEPVAKLNGTRIWDGEAVARWKED